jgi:immunity protein, SdpI family
MNSRPMILYSAAVVGVMTLLSALAWTQLPAGADIPIHWGIDGQVDGYASKEVGLSLVPILAVAIAALLAVIPRFEPRRVNLERSGKAYGAIWITIITFLGGIHALTVAAALGADLQIPRLILFGIGALFVVIGNYLPTVRPNFMMGIRTPWTLASDLSWVRTHRVGGRLFVIEGIVLIILGLLDVGPELLAITMIAAIVVLLVVLTAYSYQVWKTDPQKRTA